MDIAELMRQHKPLDVIHAFRGSGTSTQLRKYIAGKLDDQAIVEFPSTRLAKDWLEDFKSEYRFTRHVPDCLADSQVSSLLHLGRAGNLKVFVECWDLISPESQRLLVQRGFEFAVTTSAGTLGR